MLTRCRSGGVIGFITVFLFALFYLSEILWKLGLLYRNILWKEDLHASNHSISFLLTKKKPCIQTRSYHPLKRGASVIYRAHESTRTERAAHCPGGKTGWGFRSRLGPPQAIYCGYKLSLTTIMMIRMTIVTMIIVVVITAI